MSGRQVISPASVSIDFNPSDVRSEQLSSVKVPSGKLASTNQNKSAIGKSVNKNAESRGTVLLGSGGRMMFRPSSNMMPEKSTTGIELIGFKMMSSETPASSEKQPVSGQSSEWAPLGSDLPPCRVCGDKASGLHYGVNTCEACKAFFRRTLKKSKIDFKCSCTPKEKLLNKDQPRKTACPKCRYDRCINVGMSKDAIKIGRYTISRKRQNDREVKTLKQGEISQDVFQDSARSKKPGSLPHSSDQSVSYPEELSQDITSLSLQEKKVKKRRHENEEGLLYQSLTSSIFMSLLDNKQEALKQMSQHVSLDEKPGAKTTPIEALLISNSPGKTDSIQTAVSDLSAANFPVASDDHREKDLSPGVHNQTEVETSKLEQLFLAPATTKTEVPFTSNLKMNNDSTGEYKLSSAIDEYVEMLTSDPSKNEALTDNSVNVIGLKSLSHETDEYDFNFKPEGKRQSDSSQGLEESPIETLLAAPFEKYPTIHPRSELNVNVNVYGGEIPEELQGHENLFHVKQTNGQLDPGCEISDVPNLNENVDNKNYICDFYNSDFGVSGLDDDDLIENPEDIEVNLVQLQRFLNPVIQVGNGLSSNEATQMIQSLGVAASVLFDNTKKPTCEEIMKRHSEYLEQYKLKMQLFGDMSNISKEEYLDFYNQTGIDIDNRQQILIEALKYMEESIAKLVKFAKAIPGFSNLDIDDQVSLIKVSRFEFEMIKLERGRGCTKSGYQVTTAPWDKDYHIEEIQKLFPLKYIEKKHAICNEFLQIGLSFEETVCFKAIVLTFPDRCALKDRSRVEYLHTRMIACFLFMLGSRPPENLVTVQTVMGTLFKIRQLATWDMQIFQEMFEVFPVTSEHKLVKEFVS